MQEGVVENYLPFLPSLLQRIARYLSLVSLSGRLPMGGLPGEPGGTRVPFGGLGPDVM